MLDVWRGHRAAEVALGGVGMIDGNGTDNLRVAARAAAHERAGKGAVGVAGRTADLNLASIEGGSKHNAIPREAFAVLCGGPDLLDILDKAAQDELELIKNGQCSDATESSNTMIRSTMTGMVQMTLSISRWSW